MALKHRALIKGVILLVTMMPITSFGGSSSLKPEGELILKQNLQKKSFELGANWKRRLKNVGPDRLSGGGGGVDGGGGNLLQGEIFDSYQNSTLEVVPTEALTDLVANEYGERLKSLNRDLPGFNKWLKTGFEVTWFADLKPFAEDFCKNASVYKVTQQVVACQTLTSVKMQKSWIKTFYISGTSWGTVTEEEGVLGTPTSTSIIVHELVRFHVIRLAKERNLSRLDQDDIVSRVTYGILNSSVSSNDVYSLLVQTGLLPDSNQIESERQKELVRLQQEMKSSLMAASDVVQECKNRGIELNGFELALKRYVQEGELCNQESLQSEERSLCATDSNVRTLKDQHGKYCHQ